MTYTETLTPEEVSQRIKEGTEIVKNAMIQIGLPATDESVNDLLSRSLEERKQVWDAIFGKMQIGIKSFEQYLEEAKYLTNSTPETVEAMKTLHEVLNFDAEAWLANVCDITPARNETIRNSVDTLRKIAADANEKHDFFDCTIGEVAEMRLSEAEKALDRDDAAYAEKRLLIAAELLGVNLEEAAEIKERSDAEKRERNKSLAGTFSADPYNSEHENTETMEGKR